MHFDPLLSQATALLRHVHVVIFSEKKNDVFVCPFLVVGVARDRVHIHAS